MDIPRINTDKIKRLEVIKSLIILEDSEMIQMQVSKLEDDTNSVSANELYKIAKKNKLKAEKSNNFTEALKKISSKEKKLIVCFGSLYNCGNILNKN